MDSLTTVANRHDFTATFTNEYDEELTAQTVITPTSGKALTVTGVYISTEGATTIGQKIRLYFGTSADTVLSFFPAAVANQSSSIEADSILVSGAVDEPLKLTSTLGNGKNFYIAVNYREE